MGTLPLCKERWKAFRKFGGNSPKQDGKFCPLTPYVSRWMPVPSALQAWP